MSLVLAMESSLRSADVEGIEGRLGLSNGRGGGRLGVAEAVPFWRGRSGEVKSDVDPAGGRRAMGVVREMAGAATTYREGNGEQ